MWEWIRTFANNRVKAAYMQRVWHERKCFVCGTWNSEVGGCRSVRQDGEWFELTQCNRCQHWSRWDMRSMLPYLADTQPPLANLHPNH